MEEKFCCRCQKSKTVEEFTSCHGKPRSWCKECYSIYRKVGGYNEYRRYAANQIKYQRKLRKTTKHKKYERRYRSDYHASFSGTVGRLLSGARARAKNKGLEIDLDRAWIEQHLKDLICEATGVSLNLEFDRTVQHGPFRPSIDRFNNDLGYLKSNCRIVCTLFNKAKSDCKEADVLKMAKAMVEKWEFSSMSTAL